jgi:hypothetical protein
MKSVKSKTILKKVRARNGTDIFYTYSHWETKEIDGITFIPVVKSPDPIHLIKNDPKQIRWMKKDNMEYVK